MNIKPLNAMSSKEEEKAFLDKLVKLTLDPHCFLNSLFTDEMVTWCKAQIKDDLAPDLFEALKFAQELAHKATSAHAKLEQMVVGRDQTIARMHDEYAHAQQESIRLSSEYQESLHNVVQALDETREDLVSVSEDLCEAKILIRNLKSEIYDLTHKK